LNNFLSALIFGNKLILMSHSEKIFLSPINVETRQRKVKRYYDIVLIAIVHARTMLPLVINHRVIIHSM